MLVYGDPQYAATLGCLLAGLRQSCLAIGHVSRPGRGALDQLRALLILAGQAEQAAEDGLAGEERELTRLRVVTDYVAAAFMACWRGGNTLSAQAAVAASLERLAAVLVARHAPEDVQLTVKVPEGFAFYALYPEAYAAAAQCWLADHALAAPRRALVVGIRSIGTTLSAVVAAALEAAGWSACRLTVRPTGHPFDRQVALPSGAVEGVTFGLVVDEGPGLSGSSMAATAAGLITAGLPASAISFFPGHRGEPGAMASAQARATWRSVPRYVLPEAALLDGLALTASLAQATVRLTGSDEAVAAVEDLGAGQWRRDVRDVKAWPAVCTAFERPKYRCNTADGRQLLWKFGGLAWVPATTGDALVTTAEAEAGRLTARAAGWCAPPLGVWNGFIALPWLAGTPLKSVAAAEPQTLGHVGRYLAATAGPLLSAREQEPALKRLQAIVRANAPELLGEAEATRAIRCLEYALPSLPAPPAAGDGRLAPHEWLRAPDGRLWKTDAGGHDWDHSPVRQQAQCWDLAAAISEWALDDRAVERLLTAFTQAGGRRPPPASLTLHRLAYATFRAGQCRHCAALAADPSEQERLARAAARYSGELARLLAGR